MSNLTAADEIKDKMIQIIIDELGVDEKEITLNASFTEDLGADSLDTVEVIMRFEEEFGIEIPDDIAEKIKTVGEAISYVVKYKVGEDEYDAEAEAEAEAAGE